MASEAMAGRLSGSTTDHSRRRFEAPSMRAASTSSIGNWRMNECIMNTPNPLARNGSTSARKVLRNPSEEMVR